MARIRLLHWNASEAGKYLSLLAEGGHTVEYDERTDLVKLFSKAVIRQLEGKKVAQEMASEFISYDNRNEKLLGLNDATGTAKQGNGRGSITLQPRRAPAPAAGAAPAPADKQ